MAVVRITIGKGEDFEDESLADGVIPRDNLVPYVKTFVNKDGSRRTPGMWLTLLCDPTWGQRLDMGTVIETQQGFEERRPSCSVDNILMRLFVVNGTPDLIAPKRHKLDPAAQTEPVLSKTGVHVAASETAWHLAHPIVEKAELARGDDK